MKKIIFLIILISLSFPSQEALSKRKKDITFQVGILLDIHVDDVATLSYYTSQYHLDHHYYYETRPIVVRHDYYFISIKVGDLIYVGSYSPSLFKTYRPTEWVINDPVEVGFDHKYMYIIRPNGKLFKARLVKRIRVKEK